LTDRLLKLDERIRQKFSSKWQYVRQAFLDLDKDGSGCVSFDEILALFATESVKVEPGDLRLLLQIKDSSGKGDLSYKDFCIWLGQTIHMNEGFYFRHDSCRNNQ
jgi:Ca2+-binding EF-hand superfamily protein